MSFNCVYDTFHRCSGKGKERAPDGVEPSSRSHGQGTSTSISGTSVDYLNKYRFVVMYIHTKHFISVHFSVHAQRGLQYLFCVSLYLYLCLCLSDTIFNPLSTHIRLRYWLVCVCVCVCLSVCLSACLPAC